MKHEALLRKDDCTLVIIDVQEKLLPAMDSHNSILDNCCKLAAGAAALDLPCIITEQYPKGLGKTIPALTETAPNPATIEKTSFSCARSEEFVSAFKKSRKNQILLCGIETHVCMLQTALDLQAMGYQIHIAEDATGSRSPQNRENALKRMRRAGIIISNVESALFEMLDIASGDAFKAIAKIIK